MTTFKTKTIEARFVDEIKSLIEQEKLDQDALNNLITERRAEIGKKIPEVVKYFAAFHSTLTPEQKAKLGESIKNHGNCGYHSSKS